MLDTKFKENDEKTEIEAHLYESEFPLSFRMTKYRYIFLLFACLLRFGRNFSYDNPQALQSKLTDKEGPFGLSNVDYNLLYGVYSFPNIVLPLCGGFIVDKLGGRICIILFSFFLILGQFFFLMGGLFHSFALLIFGRVIFGLGGETLCVVQNTIIANWFGEKELAFALGLDITVARLGGTLNSSLTPYLYDINNSFFLPLFIGLILCVLSWFCGLAMCYMDKEADKREGLKEDNKSQKSEKIKLSDLKRFNLTFWFLVFECMMIYGAFFAFSGNANDILVKSFNMSSKSAGLSLMIFYISSAIATPFFGIFADKCGKRTTSMISMIILYIVSILMLIFFNEDINNIVILIPLIFIGIFYSMWAAAFFPCIAIVAPKNTIGTAFGLTVSFENINLSISPIIFGVIHDNTTKRGGYFWALFFVIAQTLFGLFSCVGAFIINQIKGEGSLEKNMVELKNIVKESKQSLGK